MNISGKHLPRRTFLRGMGATVALPFLDAMVPAGRSRWSAAALDKTRLICIENVHGSAGASIWGATQNLWSPAGVGRDFDLSPSSLRALEPFREYLTIVSNTDCRMAEAFAPEEIGADHFRATAVFLTQSHPYQTEDSSVYVGTSLDQMYAQRFGQETPLPSMQFCIEPVDQAGGCGFNYNCVYTDSLSWASPTAPLPMILDPRVAFDQLFGAGGTPEERAVRQRTRRSILDFVGRQMADLKRGLGADDRHRVDQYTENVRELERRIELTVARNTSGEAREIPQAPAGVPDSFREHVEMMFDLQVLAFQTDMTRVVSFKLSRDGSARQFPESGVSEGFHPVSHHSQNRETILKLAKINEYHLDVVKYLFEKLQNTVEGDAHLLDKTAILYGSPMADPHFHNHRRCPLFFAGGANGALQKGGLHLKAADGTPMANPMLDFMHRLGLEDVESFGDSTGTLPLGYPESAAASSAG
jgi:hypothetical protein